MCRKLLCFVEVLKTCGDQCQSMGLVECLLRTTERETNVDVIMYCFCLVARSHHVFERKRSGWISRFQRGGGAQWGDVSLNCVVCLNDASLLLTALLTANSHQKPPTVRPSRRRCNIAPVESQNGRIRV